MKGFLAVFRREIAERRLLAVASLVFGLLAVIVPQVPGLRLGGLPPEEVRGGVALGFALLLSTLTAVFLGGSALASDLFERRLSFYFARPLSGGALWAGKIAAALVLTFGCGLLALLPAALTGSRFDAGGIWGLGASSRSLTGADAITLWVLGILFLLLGTNALLVIVRSRSPWIALDLGVLGVVVMLVLGAQRRLLVAGVGAAPSSEWWVNPFSVFALLGNVLVLVTLLALLLAGAAQVVRGRTDVRRAHRAVSVTLWGMLLVLALGAQGLTLWWVRVSPGDLLGVTQLATAPRGVSPWIAFAGPAAHRPGYSPGFLYDSSTGRIVNSRLGAAAAWWGLPVRFSADGRLLVWLEYQDVPFRSPLTLYRLDLRRPGAVPETTKVLLTSRPEALALSPDGRRLALANRRRLTVEAIATGRLLASAPYQGELWYSRLLFSDSGHVRLYQTGGEWIPSNPEGSKYEILELDVASGSLTKTGEIAGQRGLTGWSFSPDGARVLLQSRKSCQLRDARTGELLRALEPPEGAERVSASFLGDGKVVRVSRAGELLVISPDGVKDLFRFRPPRSRAVILVEQPDPSRLQIVTSAGEALDGPWELWTLDLPSGAVRGHHPVSLTPLQPPGGKGSRLQLAKRQGVIWKEPFSQRIRVLIPG